MRLPEHVGAGIFLMGYGLVAIPRTMWREADVQQRHRLCCHQAGAQAKKALEAHQCAINPKSQTIEVKNL